MASRQRTLKPLSASWEIDQTSLRRFSATLKADGDSEAWLTLRRDAERLALLPAFDRLITLDLNQIEELPHQIRVAQQVLQPPMNGRAILADEVGLGKTIEAGLILSELAARGLAQRVLILTPASLVTQWAEEMRDKFFHEVTPIERPEEWASTPRAVASYDRARQPNHARELLRSRWDLVIVDEAHKCKNEQASRYKLLQQIERNYLLLLTATPLQNNLRELYNLVTLLRPGHLGTWAEFRKAFGVSADMRDIKAAPALRELTSQVMVRTRRSSVAHIMELPARRPRQPAIRLSAEEAAVYAATAKLLRDLYRAGFRDVNEEELLSDRRRKPKRSGRGLYFLTCLRLAQRLCSSAPALADSLRALADGELVRPEFRGRARSLADQAAAVTSHAKLRALVNMLQKSDEQAVVFTENLATVDLICAKIRDLGRTPIRFTGELSREQRRKALTRFRGEPGSVLVSTRAGTEGLNLQFCHRLVNYELPWNPMIVEQRIGRVHRIGQKHEVEIFNYAAAETVEAHILRLLHTKIRLFELVVGELDTILGDMAEGEENSLESLLGGLWLESDSDEEFESKVEGLGEELAAAREAVKAQESKVSLVAADDAAGRLEREFPSLTVPARLRLGYGGTQLQLAPGVEAARVGLGIHVSEILEMLGQPPHVEPAGQHPDYGPLYRLTGLTGRQRALSVVVQADRLPMVLVRIEGDAEAPLEPSLLAAGTA
jgi:SNF2 family DNA or RNA helicase